MEEFPKVGMRHEQVRDRMRKYPKDKIRNTNLLNSMIRQAGMHEGIGSTKELAEEFVSMQEGRSDEGVHLSGAGNKQTGMGNGVKGSSGHYVYIDGTWVKQ